MANTLNSRESIKGFDFEYSKEHNFYECRGEVMYDDDHDQMPEPALWRAAGILIERLKERGIQSLRNHSEKGWVEVLIND